MICQSCLHFPPDYCLFSLCFQTQDLPGEDMTRTYDQPVSVVRKVDSAIHRIVIFSTAAERHKMQ